MSTTVLEALQNAHANMDIAKTIPQIIPMAMDQLNNAIEALENGMGPHDIMQESMFDAVKTSKD